jgi:hypothetical protein
MTEDQNTWRLMLSKLSFVGVVSSCVATFSASAETVRGWTGRTVRGGCTVDGVECRLDESVPYGAVELTLSSSYEVSGQALDLSDYMREVEP